MRKTFDPVTFVSNENGIKFDVEDALTAKMLANPEKKAIIRVERNTEQKATKAKTGKTKHDNSDDTEQELH